MSPQVVHYQTQVKFYHIVSEMLVHSSCLHLIQSCQKWKSWHERILQQEKKLPPGGFNLMIAGLKGLMLIQLS